MTERSRVGLRERSAGRPSVRNRGGSRPLGLFAWLSAGLAAVLVVTTVFMYLSFRKLQGNIKREDVSGQLGPRPAKLNGALNILLIGSDVRTGANARYGVFGGERSDTMILLHVSPNRDKALLISFPRDSMVRLPECRARGATYPAHLGMINEAFNNGGAACSWKTIESLTGIHIDHFVKVDFTGFKRIVDVLGGVEICLPQAVTSRKARLRLPAGRTVVRGEQALGYVRVRDIGDGSDTSRIRRQQLFMGAVARKATDGALLRDPARLFDFLGAVTKSITTDSRLDVLTLKRIAESLDGLSAGKVRFVTVPWHQWRPDPNRVEWTEPAATRLFEAIKNDVEVTTPTPFPATPPGLKPAKVRLAVLNGTERAGLARQAAALLESHGFSVIKVGDAPASAQTTVSGEAGASALVSSRLLGPSVSGGPVPTRKPVVKLVIGDDWRGVRSTLPSGLRSFTATANPCQIN